MKEEDSERDGGEVWISRATQELAEAVQGSLSCQSTSYDLSDAWNDILKWMKCDEKCWKYEV